MMTYAMKITAAEYTLAELRAMKTALGADQTAVDEKRATILKKDIEKNGLLRPFEVALLNGVPYLVAGRNRLASLKLAERDDTVKYLCIVFHSNKPEDITTLIISSNKAGRKMDSAEQTMLRSAEDSGFRDISKAKDRETVCSELIADNQQQKALGLILAAKVRQLSKKQWGKVTLTPQTYQTVFTKIVTLMGKDVKKRKLLAGLPLSEHLTNAKTYAELNAIASTIENVLTYVVADLLAPKEIGGKTIIKMPSNISRDGISLIVAECIPVIDQTLNA